MIFLFTDFGATDIYVGQVRGVLAAMAPGVPVIDLLHEAPPWNVKAGAHLLAALAARLPDGSVVMAVVDPGVGSERRPVAVRADGRWYVGPDNGLISVLAARAGEVAAFEIGWRPDGLSASFHGRDLFGPVAAMVATGGTDRAGLAALAALAVDLGPEDLPEIVYADHYGNLMTGLRADRLSETRCLTVQGRLVSRARVFSDVPQGAVFWYANSIGLAEIAANGASARELLGADVGTPIA